MQWNYTITNESKIDEILKSLTVAVYGAEKERANSDLFQSGLSKFCLVVAHSEAAFSFDYSNT